MDYLGTIGTIVFGILSIYYFYRSRATKRPQFIYQSILLQTKKHPDISITFQNEQIINLSRTYVLFCNKGTKEIRKEDIPSNQFPTIIFNDGIKVLSVNKTAVSSEHNNFVVAMNSNRISVMFDYINQNDGIVFEILYDSDSNELPAQLIAPFIGTPSSRLDRFKTEYKKSDILAKIVGVSIFLLFPAIAIIRNIIIDLPEFPSITRIIFILFFIIVYCTILWKSLRDFYKYRLPPYAKDYFK